MEKGSVCPPPFPSALPRMCPPPLKLSLAPPPPPPAAILPSPPHHRYYITSSFPLTLPSHSLLLSPFLSLSLNPTTMGPGKLQTKAGHTHTHTKTHTVINLTSTFSSLFCYVPKEKFPLIVLDRVERSLPETLGHWTIVLCCS